MVKAILLGSITLLGASTAASVPTAQPQPPARPNVVILLADDMGYGDLGSYGHPSIKTPHLDRLAAQGMRFTSFVTGAWCVPSRTQLLTGRYMPRVKFGGETGADGEGGLPDSEVTLAEGLKGAGYATAMVGKWHLGYKQKKFLPPNQGFDYWFGLPYSNDYTRPWVQTDEPLALYRGTEIVTHPIDQDTLTIDQTNEAVTLIERYAGKAQPFFLYVAYSMPHLPVNTTGKFRGQSAAGLYGDVVETIDWSVGQVLEALTRHGLTDKTIVFFASDNGPWLNPPKRMLQAGNELWHAGSPGPLRGSKATTYEGGTRVPAMIRWPGHVPPNQVSDALVAMPDIYRTFLEVGRATLPDHPLDGYDLVPFLTGRTRASPRNEYFYFFHGELEAMRQGAWKLRIAGGQPELFNLQLDPGERYNRADEKPEIVDQLERRMRQFADEVGSTIRRAAKASRNDRTARRATSRFAGSPRTPCHRPPSLPGRPC
jgi:arylsulfatase A